MIPRRWRWIPIAAGVLAAGCAGEGAEGDPPEPQSVVAADSAAEPAAVESPGLPDTVGLAPAPAPPAALPLELSDTPPAPARRPAAGAAAREWAAGTVTARKSVRMTTLTEVRAARNQGFDRVVFQFAGDTVPGYHLEYVDRPVRACGSGDAVAVAGDAWLEVRLEPAQAHDEAGRATVASRVRYPRLPSVAELRSTCDFEGQVVWVLGVRSPSRFRVLELRSPARIVVDVAH